MKTEEFQYALVMLTLKRYNKFIFEENKIEPEFEEVNQGKIDWIGDKEEMDYICKFLKDLKLQMKMKILLKVIN